MVGFQKLHVMRAATLALALLLPGAPSAETEGEALDTLFAELAEPGRTDWMRVEREITRIWERSGSDAMDLLLRRGKDAMEAKDFRKAVEHLSALVDHAPDFAEGWNARATAYYLMGEYALSIADVEQVLTRNPRHFGALSGLAIMLEQLGEVEYAIKALRAVHAIHPNRPDVTEALERLERQVGGADL